jgi:hypothetical protein
MPFWVPHACGCGIRVLAPLISPWAMTEGHLDFLSANLLAFFPFKGYSV